MNTKQILNSIILSCFALAMSSESTAQADSSRLAAKAREMESKALETYNKNADTGVAYFRLASENYRAAKNYKAAAASLQNAAYVHEEMRRDNYKSMEIMREAIPLWLLSKDTAGIAAAYKYITTQHAKMNDNNNVRRKADTAISYYTKLKDNKNIAATYLIVTSMYEAQKQTDSAVKFANMAYEVQKKLPNSDAALFGINTTLFRIYVLANNLEAAKSIFKRNSKKLKLKDLAAQDKMAFYYYAWVYYSKMNQEKEATEYKAKYDDLRNSLK